VAGRGDTPQYSALEHSFVLSADDESVDVYLRHVFASLEHASGRPSSRYEISIATGPSPLYSLAIDDQVVSRAASMGRILSRLCSHLNRAAIASYKRGPLLHAAAAETGGRAVLLPGSMEVGKSTLVTALVAGGWSYLGDEAIGIDWTDGSLHGYPKPISLDPGSWPVFPEMRPRGKGMLATVDAVQWQVPVHSGNVTVRSKPGLIVFPSYRKDVETGLRPIRRSAALVRALESAFRTQHRPRDFDALARLVSSAACYELRYDDVVVARHLMLAAMNGDF
jgi:hypothetical protein